MEGRSTLNIGHHTNQCAHCPMSHACLPALLDKKTQQSAKYLHFHTRQLEPGDHLCRQGVATDHFYLIRSGMLKSYIDKEDGEEYVMDFYFPPELFGWEGIDEQQGAFSIVALEHSSVCEIPTEIFYALIREHPLLHRQFINMTAKRIHHENTKQLRTTAEQRLSQFLLMLTRHYKMLGFAHNICKLVMAHQDIANYLRLAPATVSRILHQLQNRNILTISRKEIFITNTEKLTELSHGFVPSI